MNTLKSSLVALLAGLLFGAGMIISDMVNPQKVLAFLDITGQWDPSLAFVMIGALGVFAPIYHWVIKKRTHALNSASFAFSTRKSIDPRLIIGAVIFGLGWGLVGLCPGPVVASLGAASTPILMFFPSMLVGMWVANKL